MNPEETNAGTLRQVNIIYIVCLSFFVFAFLFLLRPLYELSGNSLEYALNSKTGEELFYTPHLLYAPILRGLYLVTNQFVDCDIILVGQIHSIIWATITVVCIFIILQKLLESTIGALIGALFTLIAHDFWIFSTQLEVYIPSVGCLTLLSTILIKQDNRQINLFSGIYCGCSMLWALAVFYHQANVIFIIPLGYLMFFKSDRGAWKAYLFICVFAGLIVLTTYLAVFASSSVPKTFEDFFIWSTGIASVPMTDWGDFGHWSPSFLITAIGNQASSIVADMGNIFSFLKISKRELVALVICTILLWNIFQTFKNGLQTIRSFFLLWFVTYFLFFSWWDPRVHKFFLPSSISLIVIASLSVYDLFQIKKIPKFARLILQGGIVCLMVLIFTSNLSFSVIPLKKSKGGEYYYEAQNINNFAPEDCYLYGSGKHLLSLTFHFGRDRNKNRSVRQLYEAFYYVFKEGNLDAENWFKDENCSLIRLSWLAPKYFNYKTRTDFSPTDWNIFIDWFFEVKPGPNDGTISHSQFKVVSNQSSPLYIMVDRTKRVYSDDKTTFNQVINKYIEENYKRFGSLFDELKDPEYSKHYYRQKMAFGY